MFKNYLKIALRNIRRYKGYSFINIAGLAIGMAACILILLWVQDELSYDRFHKNADQIYRVVKYSDYGVNELHVALTPGPLSQAMKEELPEVVKATSFDFAGGMLKYKDKSFNYVEVACVEPDFFHIFSFPLIQGDPKSALSDKNSIIITSQLAERIFGKEIGIRKVLGASVPGIVKLLSKEFIILVAISNVIAWPLAYYGTKKWLQNFAYHIDLSWLFFAISGLLALLITIMVVSFQSLKVAVMNPIKSLRYE